MSLCVSVSADPGIGRRIRRAEDGSPATEGPRCTGALGCLILVVTLPMDSLHLTTVQLATCAALFSATSLFYGDSIPRHLSQLDPGRALLFLYLVLAGTAWGRSIEQRHRLCDHTADSSQLRAVIAE